MSRGGERGRRRPWLVAMVGVLVIAVVAVAVWGLLTGFRRVSYQAVEAVHVTDDGYDVTVLYIGSAPGCGIPHGVAVQESDDAVTVSGRMLVPLFLGGCQDSGHPLVSTVRLSEPLGDRAVVDRTRAGHEVRLIDGRPLSELLVDSP